MSLPSKSDVNGVKLFVLRRFYPCILRMGTRSIKKNPTRPPHASRDAQSPNPRSGCAPAAPPPPAGLLLRTPRPAGLLRRRRLTPLRLRAAPQSAHDPLRLRASSAWPCFAAEGPSVSNSGEQSPVQGGGGLAMLFSKAGAAAASKLACPLPLDSYPSCICPCSP